MILGGRYYFLVPFQGLLQLAVAKKEVLGRFDHTVSIQIFLPTKTQALRISVLTSLTPAAPTLPMSLSGEWLLQSK